AFAQHLSHRSRAQVKVVNAGDCITGSYRPRRTGAAAPRGSSPPARRVQPVEGEALIPFSGLTDEGRRSELENLRAEGLLDGILHVAPEIPVQKDAPRMTGIQLLQIPRNG